MADHGRGSTAHPRPRESWLTLPVHWDLWLVATIHLLAIGRSRALCVPLWKYKGQAYFGTGSESDRLKDTHDPNKAWESNQKYRPWNRDDPKIPEDIRQKLIRLEERMNPTHQPSTKPSPKDMLREDNILVSEHSLSKYNGIYSIQTSEINGKPWYKNNSGCMLYFYNANSGRSLMEFG
ncbi:MAG: hypothetical protein CM15mP48_2990 [Candidatus Poseidoniales archaeon]|nr:MAG: hypothetical protein CM15mP48_2990 [Candidatus Poseidoniales archaeon]